MPYALGFYLYLFVIGVVVTALAVWLALYGLLVNLTLAFSAAYLWVIVGRFSTNRRGCDYGPNPNAERNPRHSQAAHAGTAKSD
jgi:hypothetical protein